MLNSSLIFSINILISISLIQTDLTKEEIISRFHEVARETPSASNSQTTRLVVLFGEENDKILGPYLRSSKRCYAKCDVGYILRCYGRC